MKQTIETIFGYICYFILGVVLTLIIQTANIQEENVTQQEPEQEQLPDLPGVGILLNSCLKYNVPFNIALAVAMVESNCDPDIEDNINRNGSRDIGYMQLNSLYHDEREARDIELNIDHGVRYLRKMYDETGSWMKAIVRYNAGYSHDKAVEYLEKVLRGLK